MQGADCQKIYASYGEAYADGGWRRRGEPPVGAYASAAQAGREGWIPVGGFRARKRAGQYVLVATSHAPGFVGRYAKTYYAIYWRWGRTFPQA